MHDIIVNLSQTGKTRTAETYRAALTSFMAFRREQDMPLEGISEGMGHDSEATTRIYLASLETSIVDKANKMILDTIIKEKNKKNGGVRDKKYPRN